MSRTYTDEYLSEAFFEISTPADSFGGFETFVAKWHSKRVGNRVPSWSDYDLEDLDGWYGWVCVFDVIDTVEFDLHTRLWGTNIVRLLGFDMTGKTMRRKIRSENEKFAGYEKEDMTFMHRVQKDCVIGLTDGRFSRRYGSYVRYEDIFLPLSSDGEKIDKLITATLTNSL